MVVSLRKRTLILAMLVSVSLHAAAGIVLFLAPGPRADAGGSEGLQVDTCEFGLDENDFHFLAGKNETEPMQAILLTAPNLVEPATPDQPPLEAVIRDAALVGTSASDGSSTSHGETRAATSLPVRQGNDARFFDVESPGRTFVYVIDRSSSMGPSGGLQAAREQLLRSLQQLPTSARFQVIVYNRVAEPLLPDQSSLLETTPENLQRAAERLSGLRAEGGTDHLPALRRALALRPDVIFFLTDADDLTHDLLRAVARLNPGRHTIIHAIELNALNRDRPDMPMHVLARENGGTYRAVDLR